MILRKQWVLLPALSDFLDIWAELSRQKDLDGLYIIMADYMGKKWVGIWLCLPYWHVHLFQSSS